MTTTEMSEGLVAVRPARRNKLAKHSTKKIDAGNARTVAATATRIVNKVTTQ
jgi:hypothetical protein